MALPDPIPERPNELTDDDRQRLFESHELLAYHAAGRFRPCGGLNRDDYRQAARIGLMKAARVFDPERGKFSTLAYRCCKNEIVRTIRVERPGVHIPVRWQDSLSRRAKAERAGEDLPAPNKFEVAAEAARHTFSLDGDWDDEGQRPREAVESGPSPAETAEREEMAKVVHEHLDELPEDLASVVRRYYGIDCQPRTLAQIGSELGVTPEMARQLRNRALSLLRKQM